MVIIFGESLNYKSGDDFFVPSLEVPFFRPSKWPFLPKVPELGPQKKALPVPVQKFRDHFYNSNFPQKWGLQPLISFIVTFYGAFGRLHFRALLALILECKSDQN